ncbi:MAG: UbiA family prenyltransferase, partial [Pseudomonadota bacterium]
GITTRKDVGRLSGRGVGMDVVKTNIARLGGVVDVQSEQGIGTKFTITMPITLAIIGALLVDVAGAVYAVPLSSVQEAVSLSLALVAAYPFMKRVTWWPQAFLGLTFNWGALVGYSALAGKLTLAPALLYAAGVAWTLGYDTIYAHQDKEDDALIGVKSSARALGANTIGALKIFYAITIALAAAAGLEGGLHGAYVVFLAAPAAHFVWQIRNVNIDEPANCLSVFKSNREAGLLILAALLLAAMIPRA